MTGLVISIINYKTAQMTVDCVQSVLADRGDTDVRIVVIDNASQDGSVEFIANWIADQPEGTPVRMLQSATNSGFSGGHNRVFAAEPDADYYLVLNSDALMRPGFIAALMTCARANPDAGFISPAIVDEHDALQVSTFRFHSPLSELNRAAATGFVSRMVQGSIVALHPTDPIADADWVSFACVLVNGRMVKDIGPMDEGYFLYFEDTEYCLRGRRAGWGLAQAIDAHVVHFQGGSGTLVADEKARRRMPKYYYASRTRFLYQAYGTAGLLASNLLWHMGRGIAMLRRLVGKPVPPAVTAEYRDIWTNVTAPLGRNYGPEDRP